MNGKIRELHEKIKELQADLEEEMERAGERLRYRIEEKKILFEKSVLDHHKELRKTIFRFLREASLLNVLTAPVIYAMVVPIALADVCVTVYQLICFPVYGIKKVPRSDFVVIDRHHLEYLNFIEKFNCAYCGYANGVAGYLREVAARTEQYWCPIKHARRVRKPHSLYQGFEEFGDADGYRERTSRKEKKR